MGPHFAFRVRHWGPRFLSDDFQSNAVAADAVRAMTPCGVVAVSFFFFFFFFELAFTPGSSSFVGQQCFFCFFASVDLLLLLSLCVCVFGFGRLLPKNILKV